MYKIFLDTCAFFDCIENSEYERTLNHISHLDDYQLKSSISVYGEFMQKILEKEAPRELNDRFITLVQYWNVACIFPDNGVRNICYLMGQDTTDGRMLNQVTDLTHLAYAMSDNCNYFITTDRNLHRYKIPQGILSKSYFKPEMVSIKEIKNRLLNRK
jgi:predicted nucleic acid-binding protein